MSDVVAAIETSFRELVKTTRYRSITVKEICEGAYISRRTFYANFVDKRAVLAYIFRHDAIDPLKRIVSILSPDEAADMAYDIFVRFYQGIYDNAEFYSDLVKPMHNVDLTFMRVVIRAVSKQIEESAKRYNPDIDRALARHAGDFFGAAQAWYLEKWIYNSYDEPLEKIAKDQTLILMPGLTALVKKGSSLV